MTTTLERPTRELWSPRPAEPLYRSVMPDEYPSFGPDVCAWIEKYCVLPADEWLGQPFRLMQWQRDWINELYAMRQNASGEWELMHRWALLGIPKKNGKTALAAALALYHVFGDPEENDPHAVCGAASDYQADLLFGAAANMVKYSPALDRVARVMGNQIVAKNGPGLLRRVAAARGKNDGKNISMPILDELHEWTQENFDIITNGVVGRRRALIIMITTAGFDLETVCGQEFLKGVAIAEGKSSITNYLMRWYAAPKGASWKDMNSYRLAHPGFGVNVSEAALQDKIDNGRENNVRRYFLNQWTQSEDAWLEEGVWAACAAPRNGEVELKAHEPTWIGWDASTKRDSTAVAKVQWVGSFDELLDAATAARDEYQEMIEAAGAEQESEEAAARHAISTLIMALGAKLQLSVRIWDRPIDPATAKPLEDWMVPVGEVETHVREACELYDVREVAYDPMFITWSAISLEAQGIPMVEFPQTDARMVPATAATYEIIRLKKLIHEDAEDLNRHVEQTQTTTVRNGGERLSKGKAKKPMDGSVAAVMAVYRAIKALLLANEGVPHIF